MTDTPRTLAQLQALLADNIVGAISPQDERDFLVSVYPVKIPVAQFNFSALSPGGSLIVGSNVISFTSSMVCPAGLAVGSKLYISGGTGTAEVVTISAITALAGDSSGTMTFTCANTHSGAFTIKSATGGIKEAETVHPTKLLELPAGYTDIYVKITLASTCPGIIGQGYSQSYLRVNFTTTSIIEISVAGMTCYFSRFTIIPTANMTSGAAIDLTAAANVTVKDLFIGSAGSTASVYIGVRCVSASNRVYVNDTWIHAEYRGLHLEAAYFSLSNVQILSERTISNYVANGAALYLKNIAGGFVNKLIHDSGVFAYGIFADTGVGNYVNEVFISNLYLDNWATYGIYVVAGGAAGGWNISNFRIVDNHAGWAVADSAAHPMIIGNAALGWNLTNGQVTFSYGRGIYLLGCTDLLFNNVYSVPNQAAGGVAACSIANSGTPKRIKFIGCTFGQGPDLGATKPAIGLINEATIDVLSIIGCTLQAASQANSLVLSGTITNAKIADNNGIGNVQKTVASAATLALPVMDDDDVIEVTGNTNITTNITGLREGQRGVMTFTDAAPPTISAAGVIQRGFTPTRYVAYPFMYSNGKFYM